MIPAKSVRASNGKFCASKVPNDLRKFQVCYYQRGGKIPNEFRGLKPLSNYARKDNAGGCSSASLSKEPILSVSQLPLQDEIGPHNVNFLPT